MTVMNNMPNVKITRVTADSHIHFGTTVNQNNEIISKIVGSASTVGESGVNLNFEKNLFIKLRPRS